MAMDISPAIDSMFEIHLTKDDIQALSEILNEMKNPIEIYTFVGDKCRYCNNTIKLIEIISNSAPVRDGKPLIRHIVARIGQDDELFQKFNVTRVPTVAMIDGFIRYTGMPAGEEVNGLIETILRISNGETGLEEETVGQLSALKGKVHIEVVVTPTCPYCPYAALMANMFAYASYANGNKAVIADTVEAYENPDIADKYNVFSVPAIAINGKVEFIGLPTEQALLDAVVRHSEEALRKEMIKKTLNQLKKEIIDNE